MRGCEKDQDMSLVPQGTSINHWVFAVAQSFVVLRLYDSRINLSNSIGSTCKYVCVCVCEHMQN